MLTSAIIALAAIAVVSNTAFAADDMASSSNSSRSSPEVSLETIEGVGLVVDVPEEVGGKFAYKYGKNKMNVFPPDGVASASDVAAVQSDVAAVQSNVAAVQLNVDGVSSSMSSQDERLVRLERELGVGDSPPPPPPPPPTPSPGAGGGDTPTPPPPSGISGVNKQLTQVVNVLSQNGASSGTTATLASWVYFDVSEYSVSGGVTVKVAGRDFIPDMPGLYVCRWNSLDGYGAINSAPVQASSSTQVQCKLPEWDLPPQKAKFFLEFQLLENSYTVPFAHAATPPKFALNALAPTMSQVGTYEVNNRDLCGGRSGTMSIEVDDTDGHPASEVTLKIDSVSYKQGTSPCYSSIQSSTKGTCKPSPGNPNKVYRYLNFVLQSGIKKCEATVKVTASDKVGKSTSQTFTLAVIDKIIIQKVGNERMWSDGTYAKSCQQYYRPTFPYSYDATAGVDGLYIIKPGSEKKTVMCIFGIKGYGGARRGWTLIGANGETSRSCNPCIGCTSYNQGCGTIVEGANKDFSLASTVQRSMYMREMALVTYPMGRALNKNSISAAFGIYWGSRSFIRNSRSSGKAYTVGRSGSGNYPRIHCSGGSMNSYFQDTRCANKDMGMTKFHRGDGSSTMSFYDVPHSQGHNTGFDDYQDGCGCGHQWGPKSAYGHAAAVLVLDY